MSEQDPRLTGEAKSPRDKLADMFPSPEDWVALQGGRPRVFRQPTRPHARWLVLHVYEEHKDPEHRFQSGLVVPTIAANTRNTGRVGIQRDDWEGNHIERDIIVPTFMVRSLHGEVCDARSAQLGNDDGYDRVKNQNGYVRFINEMAAKGMEELRFSIGPDGYLMQPLPEIRRPSPLAVAPQGAPIEQVSAAIKQAFTEVEQTPPTEAAS